MPQYFKAIKPSKLKVDAVRLELLNEMRKQARLIIREDLEPTTATWSKRPKFESSVSLKGGAQVTTFTGSDIWHMLDVGTKKHDIWAGAYTGKSNKKTLAFPSMFTPKTTPGKLSSGPGAKGGKTVFTPYVEHPGTKARDWTGASERKRRKTYKRAMEAAMKRGVEKSGHAIG